MAHHLQAPYDQIHYMGEGTEAEVLAFIQANKWDSSGNGLGTPCDGMLMYDTGTKRFKGYYNGAWSEIGVFDHGTLSGLSDDDHSQYILVAGTRAFSGDQGMGTHKITGMGDPTDAQDAATKNYVDQAVQGLEWKDSIIDQHLSTPPAPVLGARYIVAAAGSFVITGVNVGGKTFTVAGDKTANIGAADRIRVLGSTGNDAVYLVVSSTFDTDHTDIVVTEAIADATVDGLIYYAGATWDVAGPGNIVQYNGASWTRYDSAEGWAVWINDEDSAWVFNGEIWVKFASVFNHNDLANLQGGTTAEYYHLSHSDWDTLRGTHGVVNASSLHIHDDRYFTETELGSTTGGSEGALLIGTDKKTHLNNAVSVEVALTELDTRDSPTRSTNAGTPVGVVTGRAGDICVDTTHNKRYMYDATGPGTADWKLV